MLLIRVSGNKSDIHKYFWKDVDLTSKTGNLIQLQALRVDYDLIIIGAGPAGISACLTAKKQTE